MTRPNNFRELFNLRHAMARNAVERIFGIVKRRFRLLVAAPEYSLKTQAQMIPALCALHNFIRIHDADDIPPPNDFHDHFHHNTRNNHREELGGQITSAEKQRAITQRDTIAMAMWEQYISIQELCR